MKFTNLFATLLILIEPNALSSFKIPLPGGRSISYNTDTGVLRIKTAEEKLNVKVPARGANPKPNVMNSIQIKISKGKGYGAFATAGIAHDTFLGFYDGDIVRSKEALDVIVAERERDLQNHLRGNTKCPTNAMDYIMSLDGGVTFIDGYER